MSGKNAFIIYVAQFTYAISASQSHRGIDFFVAFAVIFYLLAENSILFNDFSLDVDIFISEQIPLPELTSNCVESNRKIYVKFVSIIQRIHM